MTSDLPARRKTDQPTSVVAPEPPSPEASSFVHIPRLPAVDQLMNAPSVRPLLQRHGHSQTAWALRAVLDDLRQQARRGANVIPLATSEAVATQAAQWMAQRTQPRLRTIFNLDGTVLHTSLGRALLPDDTVQAVIRALTTPQTIDHQLAASGTPHHEAAVEQLLTELTGAEGALVVNNNAAAVLLALSTLAQDREVVVSHDDLAEGSDTTRLTQTIERAGARLLAVGKPHRTEAFHYRDAITPDTALLMRVRDRHVASVVLEGFDTPVAEAELVRIAQAAGLRLLVDLGNGTLADRPGHGTRQEPTVREAIAAGVDLVTFSGDKLLGGSRAGLIVGRRDLIERIRQHPLKRALPAGAATLAALEPMLQLHRTSEFMPERLATLRLFTRQAPSMQQQAQRLLPQLRGALGSDWQVQDERMLSQIGGDALPVDSLPSHGLVIRSLAGRSSARELERLEAALRALPRPVVGRVVDGALRLDLRCLEERDEASFGLQLQQLAPG